MSSYSIIIPHETQIRAAKYLKNLRSGLIRGGHYLDEFLQRIELKTVSEQDLFSMLLETKTPQIYAESEVVGNGTDWNLTELGLLGDISIAAPVTIFDDGNHTLPTLHEPPFSGVLVFTPGALLRNRYGYTPADWNEVTKTNGQLSKEGYYKLYRRRLLPVLQYINANAGAPRSAFVTIPGLGCGQFAGPFAGQLGERLQGVLQRLLQEQGSSLSNIKAVYFDPYSECENFRDEIQGISFMVRPLRDEGNHEKSQLCRPSFFEEEGDDFSNCTLYSIVAWDHVSWPGNDFYLGSRATDDGVKAAATSSMSVFSGVLGQYDETLARYQPPKRFKNWKDVVEERQRKENLRLWNSNLVWKKS